ncbi:hypothetical protein WJX74_005644 [Apatococcus lobatus]|uniref:Uncharacterized protein n=2 Tax=Apatococcus TaxID=904362 RepID=A0AAW1RZG7_9CHLO
MARYMDTLGDLSSASDSDSDEPAAKKTTRKQKSKSDPDPEALEAAGFKSGPSVLHVPEPTGESSWDWAKGQEGDAAEPESIEERERTRQAANAGVEEATRKAAAAAEQAKREKLEEKLEQQELARRRGLSFQQREKRKRELGQAKKDKNYVEEEKRLARGFGIHSGFDQ